MERLDLEKFQIGLGYWGELPAQFQQLTPDQQERYLAIHGYRSFRDLLAHFVAWWERGMMLIEQFRTDATFTAPPVEVDEFNAKTVAGVQGKSEEEIRDTFESARLQLIKLVGELTYEEWQDERIKRHLEMEIIGHYHEHRIEKPADD